MNNFIWSDLSTFDMQQALDFYRECFGWNYSDLDEQYKLCNLKNYPVAGIYPMPEKFQKINMPSFWMSYIQVEDIYQIVRVAEEHGARIEVRPEADPSGGLVALIRDPAGAGFTCYQGDELGKEKSNAWHELHVSDLSKVESFYSEVFAWDIKPSHTADRFIINNASGEPIAGIQVTSNDIKGDKEYWGVYFAVKSLGDASKIIERNGGTLMAEQPLGDRPAILASDNQGAAFYIVEDQESAKTTETQTSSGFKWRAVTGLVIIAIAIVFNLNWVWGLLFLSWVIPDIINGSTHFLEHVERKHNPIIYWLIVFTWLVLSLYFLLL